VLGQALEKHGWDGSWYRRAYYDDGTPLGSAQNRECQIDAIAQSWGILSGAADPERSEQAMQAVLERLVKWDERLILLFAPPFDETIKDPGYIKGYLPGIRENGGQYTHAALWTIWAFAELGQGELAESLFRLINPIYRADTPEKAIRYKVEPYVIAADVYGSEPHTGQGGWSWYTGSSGWMYRLGIEGILGLHRTAKGLAVSPCVPKKWKSYNLTYRHHQTTYIIHVENPDGVCRGVKQVLLDGRPLADGLIPWLEDGCEHQVMVKLGW
jgi:cellobiose phosphorylase